VPQDQSLKAIAVSSDLVAKPNCAKTLQHREAKDLAMKRKIERRLTRLLGQLQRRDYLELAPEMLNEGTHR
jgi:hypothetical protein